MSFQHLKAKNSKATLISQGCFTVSKQIISLLSRITTRNLFCLKKKRYFKGHFVFKGVSRERVDYRVFRLRCFHVIVIYSLSLYILVHAYLRYLLLKQSLICRLIDSSLSSPGKYRIYHQSLLMFNQICIQFHLYLDLSCLYFASLIQTLKKMTCYIYGS